jgi:hypothetical protein
MRMNLKLTGKMNVLIFFIIGPCFPILSYAGILGFDGTFYAQNQNKISNREIASHNSQYQVSGSDTPEKVFNLSFNFGTKGSQIEDDNVSSNVSKAKLGVEFNWNITNWLQADFNGAFQF